MPAQAARRARNIRQTVTAARALAVQARDHAPLPGPDTVETRRDGHAQRTIPRHAGNAPLRPEGAARGPAAGSQGSHRL
ncbi:hypothetical protein CT19431_MP130030 [Cupriavidus taiwanensis]|nr:hypothetical protein CT19431_MP130030 [Cupriavidus taiwanensis]